MVYLKPALEKFGEFRELTLVGFTGGGDGASVFGPHSRRQRRSRRDRSRDEHSEASSS